MAENQNNNLNIEELRKEYEEFKMLGVDEKTLKKIEDAINQLEKREEEKKKKEKEAKKKAADVAKKLKEDKKNEEKQKKKVADNVKKFIKDQEKQEEENLEEIDQEILDILGLDKFDIEMDPEEYRTLLLEKIQANKQKGQDSSNAKLANERKRVRGSGKKFTAKKKKTVKPSNFVGKDTTKKEEPQKIQTDKLLPSAGQTGGSMQGEDIDARIEDVKVEIEENTQQKLLPLSQSLDSIAQTLEGILNTNQKKLEIEQQAARDAAKKEETEGFKEKEAELEDVDIDKKIEEGLEKKLNPTTSIFDMILGFFKNVLLGGAITGLIDIFQNPAKFLGGLTNFLNDFINFANGIIQQVSQFIFSPFNAAISGINFALNELEFAMKQIGKIIPLPNIKFPDIPLLQIPNLPTIPPNALANLLNIQQQAGGGEVMPDGMSFLEGGAIDNLSGMRIKGMGKDTQLIAAQPGEVMMSKKAVEMFGADTLLGMNEAAGGNNKPKYGKIPGFQDGGQVGKVIIGAGHAQDPSRMGSMLGIDGRPVQGTQDYGTGVSESAATKHVVDTLRKLVDERGLSDKIGFRDILSYEGLTAIPREVESVRGQQYVDLHFDARGYGKAGVIPARNVSSIDRSLMQQFGQYYTDDKSSEYAVTKAGGTLLELARIDDPAMRALLMEAKKNEIGPASMQMAEKILRGILPGIQGGGSVDADIGRDFTMGAGAIDAFDSTGTQKARVGPTNITMNNISPPVMSGGGGATQVVPVPQSTGQVNSAASAAQGKIPTFNAEDAGNFDLIVVKSIYNIVG